jgi:predicted alpha/beta hydrolase family esterase
MGAGFTLRLLEESEQRVAGTFLVAGFIGALGLPDYDPINATFFASPFGWHKIRQNAGRVYVYAGDNDPYVPVERSNEIAHHLASTLQVIPGGGHLNAETDFVTFPRLLKDMRPLLAH